MKLSKLLYPGEYTSASSPEEIEISGIVSDTAALCKGCLFICLRGTRFDSHTLLTRIEEAEAAAVIVERGAPIPASISLPVFTVPATRTALALAHSRYHGSPERELVMIGVTGTNGKTSTASILYTILCSTGIKAGLIGTAQCLYNGKVYTLPEEESGARLRTMTTPDPDILYPMLRMMRSDGVTHVVMEVSSHSLVLDKVAPIRYRVGIFTNLSPEHMDFHSDMDAYMKAKSLLFAKCDVGIFNCDDGYAEAIIARSPCAVRRTGVVWQGDYRATDIELRGSRGISYSYLAPGIRLRVRAPLPGAFSVYNTLAALTAAIELGISPLAAADALSIQAPVPGRLERLPLNGTGFSVFIDYAHTEHALRSLLTTVRAFRRPEERIVLLFGCGGDRDKSKRAPMGRVAEDLADEIIVTSDNCRAEDPKEIIRDILSGMRDPERPRVIVSRRRAIEEAILSARDGDIILLCGKGHETYEITASGIRHFDERKIVAAALEKRKTGDTGNEN